MWRPQSLGDVVAERICDLRRGGRRVGRVTVSLGRPVRAPDPNPRGPLVVHRPPVGHGIELERPIAGADSLQALLLALEFAADILPHEAESLGARLDWLGQPERLVLAKQAWPPLDGQWVHCPARPDLRRAARAITHDPGPAAGKPSASTKSQASRPAPPLARRRAPTARPPTRHR